MMVLLLSSVAVICLADVHIVIVSTVQRCCDDATFDRYHMICHVCLLRPPSFDGDKNDGSNSLVLANNHSAVQRRSPHDVQIL